jgi:putative hydrolase of the HAD superfamily
VLAALQARGVGLGVLSNWDGSLKNVLRDLGLMQFFDFVLVSSETGIQKPQREFFEQGLRLAQAEYSTLQAQQCYYVGDHYDGDVAGARNAGMIPVWLVREARDLASGELRDDDEVLRIRDLRELLALV